MPLYKDSDGTEFESVSLEKKTTFFDLIMDKKYSPYAWEPHYFPDVEIMNNNEHFMKHMTQFYTEKGDQKITNIFFLADKEGFIYKIDGSGYQFVRRDAVLFKLSFTNSITSYIEGIRNPVSGSIMPVSDVPIEYIVELDADASTYTNIVGGRIINNDPKSNQQIECTFRVINLNNALVNKYQSVIENIPTLLKKFKIPGVRY